jgi:hypothetical protein
VIVRISTEGQYELAETDVEELNELDNQAVAACDSQDDQQFRDTYKRLLDFVRTKGQPVQEDRIEVSEVILPPPDVSLQEARAEFSGEGLIPG